MDLRTINSFQRSSNRKIAFYSALRVGCPTAEEIINTRGEDEMAARYTQILFWYGYLFEEVTKYRPDLAKHMGGYARYAGQRLTKFDDQVPYRAREWVVGPETLEGYDLPRMMLAWVLFKADTKETTNGILFFQECLNDERVKNPYDLVALFGEKLYNGGRGLASRTIFRNMISNGKLEQDQMYKEFERLFSSIRKLAPNLNREYEEMPMGDKDKLNLA